MKLTIKVENSYLVLDILDKRIQILVSPVLNRYIRILDFDRDTEDLLLEAEFLFRDGTTAVEEDAFNLTDALSWGFFRPQELVTAIHTIVLE